MFACVSVLLLTLCRSYPFDFVFIACTISLLVCLAVMCFAMCVYGMDCFCLSVYSCVSVVVSNLWSRLLFSILSILFFFF